MTVGVFLPWFSGLSAWDIVNEPHITAYSTNYLLILIGAVLVLFGGITLAFKLKNAVYTILIGGILAAFGIYTGSDMSYGYYICLVGNILGVICGTVGLKMLSSLTAD